MIVVMFTTICCCAGSDACDLMYAYYGDAGGPYSQSAVHELDPNTDTWQRRATIPVGTYRGNHTAEKLGSDRFTFSGQNGAVINTEIWRYRFSTDTVSQMGATMNTGRRFATSGEVGTKAYIFGGLGPGVLNTINDTEEYTPSTDITTLKTDDFGVGRSQHGAFELDDRYVHVCGNWFFHIYYSGVIMHFLNNRYDAVTDSWTAKAFLIPQNVFNPLALFYAGHGASPLNDKGYVYGPSVTIAYFFIGINMEYRPSPDVWTIRASPWMFGSGVPAILGAESNCGKNWMYSFSSNLPGLDSIGYYLGNQVYDPETDTWMILKKRLSYWTRLSR